MLTKRIRDGKIGTLKEFNKSDKETIKCYDGFNIIEMTYCVGTENPSKFKVEISDEYRIVKQTKSREEIEEEIKNLKEAIKEFDIFRQKSLINDFREQIKAYQWVLEV